MKEELEQKIHDFAEQMYKAGFDDGQKEKPQAIYEMKIAEYKKGLNDAWECIKKLEVLFETDEWEKIFGDHSLAYVLKQPISEVIAKIKEYEEKQKQNEKSCKNCNTTCIENNRLCIRWTPKKTEEEWDSETMCGQFYENDEGIKAQIQTDDEIKVGDVVSVDNVVEDKTAIVTCVKGWFAFILFNDGETACVNVSEIHKTGWNCPVVTMESLRYTQDKMQEEEHEYE